MGRDLPFPVCGACDVKIVASSSKATDSHIEIIPLSGKRQASCLTDSSYFRKLTDFNLHSASRGPSAIAELLVEIILIP